ncbi:MAG: hypothetical protein ACRDRN_15080 [Sciscionella sp.]
MTYPQQPGQYPGQQPDRGAFGQPGGYGPQPGQYPGSGGFPQAPPPPAYPGYPGGADLANQRPSGGTAITAGVLAILGAVWAIILGIVDFSVAPAAGQSIAWVVWLQAIVYVIEFFTLLPGAIMLFMRKSLGRWLIVVGCAAHIVQGIVAFIGVVLIANAFNNQSSAFVGGGVVGILVVLLPAIATLILALVPLTGRWVAWGSRPAPAAQTAPYQPGPYPPQF